MVGILWPKSVAKLMYQLALLSDTSVAICPFQGIVWVQGIPRRSSSRSLSGLRYERELFLMSSAVSLMAAIVYDRNSRYE